MLARPTRAPSLSRNQRLFFLIAILLVAGFLRLYNLADIPPGLFRDEAFKGLDELRILQTGNVPIFFEANEGREPLFLYLQTIAIALWGPRTWTLRLVAAFVGILTIPLVYRLGATLFTKTRRGYWLGIIAAASLAICYWHVHASRIGLRAILLPLLSTTAFLFFWRGWQTGRIRDWVLGGIALGACLYTYTAARLLPFVILGFVLWQFLSARLFRLDRTDSPRSANMQNWNGWLRGLAIVACVALLVALPLLIFFWQNPLAFGLHTTLLSIFDPAAPWQENSRRLVENMITVLRMFVDRGDPWQHDNLPERPAVDAIAAFGFWIGVIVAARRVRQPEYAWLLIWIGTMLIPPVLSDNPPNFFRAIGVLPPMCLLVAAGWVNVWQRVKLRWEFLVVGILALSGALTARDYFGVWALRPKLEVEFDDGIVTAALRARTLLDQFDVVMPLRLYGQPAAQFLLAQHFTPTTWLPAETTVSKPLIYITSSRESDDSIVVLLHSDNNQTLGSAFIPRVLDQTARDVIRHRLDEPTAQPLFDQLGTRVGTTATFAPGEIVWQPIKPDSPLDITFGEQMQLVGYDSPTRFAAPGQRVQVVLYWRAPTDLVKRYVISLSLQDSQQAGWASLDREPLSGNFPTDTWRAGESIVDIYRMTIPLDAHPGKYHFGVGLRQNWIPDLTLSAPDRAGGTTDRVPFGVLTVRSPDSAPKPPSTELNARFGSPLQIILLGCDFDSVAFVPNAQIPIRLVWRASSPIQTDYTVFVHLQDSRGNLVAQHDGYPQDNYAPTSQWFSGETIADTHLLHLPGTLAPGRYTIAIGLYDSASGARAPVFDANGKRQTNDAWSVPLEVAGF